MAQKTSVSSSKVTAFIREKKGLVAALCGILLTAVLLLAFINPANSPTSVFNSYLDCLHSQNAEKLLAISYEANFSKITTPETVSDNYGMRFSSADNSYKSGGEVDLLKGTQIKVTDVKTPKQSEQTSIRTSLADQFENTGRITDVRDISFDINRSGATTKGTARAICVTGKWYIHEVSGI